MGMREANRERTVFTVTTPCGMVVKYRRLNALAQANITGALPSLVELANRTASNGVDVTYSWSEIRDGAERQRAIWKAAVMSPKIDGPENDPDSIPFEEIDPVTVNFVIALIECRSGVTGEAAAMAKSFPTEQDTGTPA